MTFKTWVKSFFRFKHKIKESPKTEELLSPQEIKKVKEIIAHNLAKSNQKSREIFHNIERAYILLIYPEKYRYVPEGVYSADEKGDLLVKTYPANINKEEVYRDISKLSSLFINSSGLSKNRSLMLTDLIRLFHELMKKRYLLLQTKTESNVYLPQARKLDEEARILILKSIWLNEHDIKKGEASIIQMAKAFNFATLIDAFMATRSLENLEEMDINERIKRIFKPRIQEFTNWKKNSESKFKKNYSLKLRAVHKLEKKLQSLVVKLD